MAVGFGAEESVSVPYDPECPIMQFMSGDKAGHALHDVDLVLLKKLQFSGLDPCTDSVLRSDQLLQETSGADQ